MDFHRQKEGIARLNPARAIRRETARRYGAVNVRMQEQILPPRVQNAEESDLGSEVPGVGRNLEQRCRAGVPAPGIGDNAGRDRSYTRWSDDRIRTHVDVAAQRRRAAASDRLQNFELLKVQPGSTLFEKTFPLGMNDVGHSASGFSS